MARNQPADDLLWVGGWLALLWAIGIIDWILIATYGPGASLCWYGVWPREPRGLPGILLAPFLHGGPAHLAANSLSLLVLGLASCRYGRRNTLIAAAHAALFAGLVAWLIGDPGKPHVGASGVIFGLIGYLLLNGLVRRSVAALALALIILLLFSSSLWTGMLPDQEGRMISWQMHLGGFLGGLSASWGLRRQPVR